MQAVGRNTGKEKYPEKKRLADFRRLPDIQVYLRNEGGGMIYMHRLWKRANVRKCRGIELMGHRHTATDTDAKRGAEISVMLMIIMTGGCNVKGCRFFSAYCIIPAWKAG